MVTFTRHTDGQTIVANDINELQVGLESVPVRSPIETTLYVRDDFLNGSSGDLGWTTTGGTTSIPVLGGHPGSIRRNTGTVSGTVASSRLSTPVAPADTFDLRFNMFLTQNDANTVCRMGLSGDATINAATEGIWIEKLAADTSWFGVVRVGGASTRTAALGAVSAGTWINGRVRRVNDTTVAFSLDGGTTDVTSTATAPTSGIQPFVHVTTTTTVSKDFVLDWFDMLITGLTR